VNAATLLLGHLAGAECRRALARGWLIVVRSLVGMALAAVLAFTLWTWWMSTLFDPNYSPRQSLEAAFGVSVLILLTIVVIQAPAVLAGSLAGERERGVLQLLLTTAVSPREIVTGRLIGKLSQVGMILLVGLPFIALLAVWNGLAARELITFFLLLSTVAFGAGGLAVGASVVSRRGRDALLSVYIIMLLLVLSPMLAALVLPLNVARTFELLNPYNAISSLVWQGAVSPALLTAGIWLAIGITGTVVAAWRLRPTCLAQGDQVKKSRRRLWVPALGDWPMLWKELYIERVGTLGRFGRWLGILITALIGGGSLVLGGMYLSPLFLSEGVEWSLWAKNVLAAALSDQNGRFMGWLLQWAIGLRAAVSIASERERGTWDALLMSPLEPGEIVRAKLSGSLNALRYMAGAMVLAWTLGLIIGAVGFGTYIEWIAANITGCVLMAAVGVRCSLSLPTATKAMTWTISLWIGAAAVVGFLAISVIALGFLICVAIWMYAVQNGLVMFNSTPWLPMRFAVAWPLSADIMTVLVTFLIVLDTSLRFDRIAGRMAGGAVGVRVDKWLHGHTLQPVFIPAKKSRQKKKAVLPLIEELVPSGHAANSPATEPPVNQSLAVD
jgi:ABC-type transport system involved in multi-copper enzyme maturation permease subunit